MAEKSKSLSRTDLRKRMFLLVKRYESGSRTQAEFCGQYGLALGTFQYWLRKARDQRGDGVASLESSGFVAIKVAPPSSAPHSLRLSYPDGSSLSFDSSVPAAYIRDLIPGFSPS